MGREGAASDDQEPGDLPDAYCAPMPTGNRRV